MTVSMDFIALGNMLTSERDIVVMLKSVDGIDLSSDIELLNGVVEVLDGWMLLVTAKDLLCLLRPGCRVSIYFWERHIVEAYLSGL